MVQIKRYGNYEVNRKLLNNLFNKLIKLKLIIATINN